MRRYFRLEACRLDLHFSLLGKQSRLLESQLRLPSRQIALQINRTLRLRFRCRAVARG
ncbi:hypothetical protein L0337_26650 [candidate division KSB1 bacterium]|nr:hypothetical protein [candidate division KSB1 bacterium]